MSEPQVVANNTWTRIHGTDVEILIQSGHSTPLEVEALESDKGELFVQVTTKLNSGTALALRAPGVVAEREERHAAT